jgi:predicted phosphoribosyltransferase
LSPAPKMAADLNFKLKSLVPRKVPLPGNTTIALAKVSLMAAPSLYLS